MKISIRLTLILGVLGLIWGTQSIITSSTYFSSEKVLLRHAHDIMQNIAELTIEKSKNHLSLAQGAARLTERLITSEVVGGRDDQAVQLERYFLDQLAIYPHFAGIYVGKPNGDFFYVNRDTTHAPDGFRTKIITHKDGKRQTRFIWRDRYARTIDETLDPADAFDPRVRPWYRKAVDLNTIVWTDPYIFFSSQKPGITIAGPIYPNHRRDDAPEDSPLQAIVGVDIEIDQLSTFIGNLRIGKNGSAFMINNNGDVVAFPDVTKLTHTGDRETGNIRLVKIDELDHALSKAAFEAIGVTQREDGHIRLDGPCFARFIHGGQAYHTMFTPFLDPNWPWIIGVYLPESDYLGSIKSNRSFNLLITLAFTVLATLIGLRAARGIIRPLANLEKEALAIKQHDLSKNFDTGSRYKEIQETADSFTRMKEALRSSEEKYRTIFENIQDVYYEITLDGRILEISPSVEKFSSYTREELIGVTFDRFYADPQTRRDFIDTILKQGKVDDYELQLRNREGESVYCAINAVIRYRSPGVPDRIIGSLRAINDRKRAEFELRRYQNQLEELVRERTRDMEKTNDQLRREVETRKKKEEQLQKSEAKYRSIVENISNGYYEIDLEGNLTFFNDPLAAMFGYADKQALMGVNYRDYIDPHEIPAIETRFKKIFATGEPHELSRYTITDRNGARKTIEATAALMNDDDGRPTGFRGLVMDITERLNAEKEKQKLEARFQQIQRLEGIGTLAGGVAHDFNNLLMGIQGNVSLMLLHTPPGDRNFDKLKSIEACVAGGADLTRQLLGFARGGKYLVKPVDLNQVVIGTAGMFGRTRKEIQIIQKHQENIWPVMADQSQIEQVLLNLCINAWQAMPDGGNIFVETQNVTIDDNLARSFGIAPGRYVRISVADTGTGISPEIQHKIFEPFFTTKEIGRGTGLGLASTYGIIKNHDGAIEFVSRPGEGTTFYVYLPATDFKVQNEPTAAAAPPKGSGTILLVDDEEVILDVNRAMLETLGYTVLSAHGGKEAIDLYQRAGDRIDMVILDMVMPGMGGGEVFDRLKAMNPHVNVLLSSGYSLTEKAEEIVARGCRGFIQKPFGIDQLSLRIREIIGN